MDSFHLAAAGCVTPQTGLATGTHQRASPDCVPVASHVLYSQLTSFYFAHLETMADSSLDISPK